MSGGISGPLLNIGPKGRNRRLVVGSIAVFGTFVAIQLLLRGEVPLWYRLAPLPLFWFGSLCIVQALQGT